MYVYHILCCQHHTKNILTNGDVMTVVYKVFAFMLHKNKTAATGWNYDSSNLPDKKNPTTCIVIFIPVYDCIGNKIKNWERHTCYLSFFLPSCQDEEITAKLSRLVSLICLGLLGLFCECSYFVVAAFWFYNPHMKWP